MSQDVTEFENVKEIEFKPDDDKILIYQCGGEPIYIAVDVVRINPKNVNVEEIIVRKQYSKVRFKNPTVCYLNEGRYESYLECGTESKDKDMKKSLEIPVKNSTNVICSKKDEETNEKKLLDENENRKISYC